MVSSTVVALAFALILHVQAHTVYTNPFPNHIQSRDTGSNTSSALQVDLGYSVYRGFLNETTGLNTWLGVRFAAPPTGSNRWQAPQPPYENRSSTFQANEYAPICYQAPDAGLEVQPVNQSLASEDCLFLNVWSPANATGYLPVFVWIHGGGYGAGSGRQDQSALINTNGDAFVSVTIQYRLGAFGFLSSDEVARYGTPNAGIYDQTFALQWVQRYIHLFGGDPTQVTIGGESAGAGSVMLQDIAYGGTLGTTLFRNTFAASPYLPMQYEYNGFQPTQSYYAFAGAVGCGPTLPYGGRSQTIFECLQAKDVATLVNASATISQSGTYGTWAFLPVTDYNLIPALPSQALLKRRLNGLHILVGNNANEGPSFTPQNITTEISLIAWLNTTFPLFSPSDIAKILLYYPTTNDDTTSTDFATDGYDGPTALNQSSVATGQQQRANNIYAETTFVCPSYWLAEAYTPSNGVERRSYKYQYSVPPALHGSDVAAYFAPPNTSNIGPDMSTLFKRILGNFIIDSDPSVPVSIAIGTTSTSNTSSYNTSTSPPSPSDQVGAGPAAIAAWPPFSPSQPWQIDLNQTGGTPTQVPQGALGNVTEFYPPGTTNSVELYNAWTWEGGRGVRCDFWRAMGVLVPE
jgi:carboxylesterase type B